MIDKFYLNIQKIDEIKSDITRQAVINMYNDMITYYANSGINVYTAYFNTLYYNGYLENIRDGKIKGLL